MSEGTPLPPVGGDDTYALLFRRMDRLDEAREREHTQSVEALRESNANLLRAAELIQMSAVERQQLASLVEWRGRKDQEETEARNAKRVPWAAIIITAIVSLVVSGGGMLIVWAIRASGS